MRFESQLSRMNCRTFSTGLSSGHFDGSGMRVMLADTTSAMRDFVSSRRRSRHFRGIEKNGKYFRWLWRASL